MNDYPTLTFPPIPTGPTRTQQRTQRRRYRRTTYAFTIVVAAATIAVLYAGGTHIRRVQASVPACVAAGSCHCRYPPRHPHAPIHAHGNGLCVKWWPRPQAAGGNK